MIKKLSIFRSPACETIHNETCPHRQPKLIVIHSVVLRLVNSKSSLCHLPQLLHVIEAFCRVGARHYERKCRSV